jgi:hypothetical protein
MANSITLTSDSYLGREFIFTVTQYGTSTTVNWTFEVTKMDPGNGTLADVTDINCTINGHSVYSYPATGWSQSTKFPVYYGSISGSYDIGSYGTFSVVLSGRPGYNSPTSKSGTITLTQPTPPEPPTPSVNTISVQSIPDFIAGYDGDSFMLTCNPSGGTGYTYKWYQGATIIATSQNLTGTLLHNTDDNTYVYCVVTDSTGGTATTNNCEFRVGTSASQTQVSTKQIQPVRIYNGRKFLYGIPLIYNSGWKYNSWNITYTGNNRANIAIAGNAIVG